MKNLHTAKWNDVHRLFDNGMLIPKMHMDSHNDCLEEIIQLCQESTRWHEVAKKSKLNISHLPLAPSNTGFFNGDGDWVSVYNFQTYLNSHQKMEFPLREIEMYHAVVREAERQGHLHEFLYKESQERKTAYSSEADLGI